MKAIGFTGTRKGMTQAQRRTLTRFKTGIWVFHHGACDGADTEATAIFFRRRWWIHAWPGRDPNLEAMAMSHTIHRPSGTDMPDDSSGWDHLQRNRLIVDASDLLIATPSGYKDIPRGSGTWYTIRYARSAKKPGFIIWPDGSHVRL